MNELTNTKQKVRAYHEGFKKGYIQLRIMDIQDAKRELFEALGIAKSNRYSWGNYLKGKTETKASQAVAIEAIFRKYGIAEVWGK